MSANTLYKDNEKGLVRKNLILGWAAFFSCLALTVGGAIAIALSFPRSLKTLQFALLSVDLVLGISLSIFLLTVFLLPLYADRKVLVSMEGEALEAKEGTIISVKRRTLFLHLLADLVAIDNGSAQEEFYLDLDKGQASFKKGDKVKLTVKGRFIVGYESFGEKSPR